MIRLISFFLMLTFFACSSKQNGPQFDLKSYKTETIASNAQLVSYQDDDLFYLATGTVIDGTRNGAWVTYHPQTNKIKSITNYVNGVKNGIQINMNDRGQIVSMIGYKNDIKNGIEANYDLGRPTDETSYANGILDGPFAIYNSREIIQRKGFFKNGKQHDKLQYFDESGNLTLEYLYNNGEKLSGGIIEKTTEE